MRGLLHRSIIRLPRFHVLYLSCHAAVAPQGEAPVFDHVVWYAVDLGDPSARHRHDARA